MARFDPAQPLSPGFTDAVGAALDEFLAAASEELTRIDSSLTFAADLARRLAAGGKRLRPAFCYWARVAAAGQPDDDAALIRAAASLDLLHLSALVHDDVMDASDLRRGEPTAHRAYQAEHEASGGRGDAEAHGRSGAILLGDLLATWSAQLAEGSGLPAADRVRARRYLEAARVEVLAGQFLDLAAQTATASASDQRRLAEHVVEFKTARYTIQRPAQYGASLGGGTDDLIGALGTFGLPLGRAFQYRDDLLGVFGDEAVTGKPSGDDLREGKRTVLVAEAAASGVGVGAELDALLGTPLDQAGLDRARELLTESGAVARVEALIAADYELALAILDQTAMTDDGRTALRELARACVERSF